MVVDDDEGILDALDIALRDEGYRVVALRDADVSRIREARPDLIILDVILAGRDGRDIVRELKRYKKTRAIPVIMTSAHPGVADSTVSAGADDFLEKPFDIDEMLFKIRYHLKTF